MELVEAEGLDIVDNKENMSKVLQNAEVVRRGRGLFNSKRLTRDFYKLLMQRPRSIAQSLDVAVTPIDAYVQEKQCFSTMVIARRRQRTVLRFRGGHSHSASGASKVSIGGPITAVVASGGVARTTSLSRGSYHPMRCWSRYAVKVTRRCGIDCNRGYKALSASRIGGVEEESYGGVPIDLIRRMYGFNSCHSSSPGDSCSVSCCGSFRTGASKRNKEVDSPQRPSIFPGHGPLDRTVQETSE